MKKLLLILIVAAAASCSKDTGQCYTCTFGTVIGTGSQPPPEDYCGPLPYVKKVNGNNVATYCVPK